MEIFGPNYWGSGSVSVQEGKKREKKKREEKGLT
jgi:hypothetical protein